MWPSFKTNADCEVFYVSLSQIVFCKRACQKIHQKEAVPSPEEKRRTEKAETSPATTEVLSVERW
jgi:hypothetical protein